MIGNNSMELNQSTMVEAVQCWVAKTFQEPRPLVKSVKVAARAGSYSSSESFTVELEQMKEKPDAKP